MNLRLTIQNLIATAVISAVSQINIISSQATSSWAWVVVVVRRRGGGTRAVTVTGIGLHVGICLLPHEGPVNFELSYKEGNSDKEVVLLYAC